MPQDRQRELSETQRQEEREVIAFLSDPKSHGTDVDKVTVIETHAARVFLAGSKAIKVKKRVRLPFLDFSTTALRHAALAEELSLNSPHAPEIYGSLVPIGRAPDGALAFGAEPALDYALVMRRFEQESLLSHVAARGELTPALARSLAEMIVRYHRALAPAAGISGAKVMSDTIRQLATTLVADAPDVLAAEVAEFARMSGEQTEALAPLLDARSGAGKVRRCHGDLHLGNIVLIEDRPVPFDALEFDERLATIDVLYDLAFLLMDLDVRGHRAAANAVLNAYIVDEATGSDLDGLEALPLFLATRAAVRTLVATERILQAAEGAAEHVASAASYIRSANAYLKSSPPVLIAVGGLSGTGKSTLAAGLAPLVGPAPGALVLRTDIERKRMFEVPETQRLTADHYSEALSDEVYAVLYAKAARALAAGHAVIFDGVSAKPAERERLAEIAAAAGVGFHGLWLEAPLETQIARVEARVGDASDSNASVVRAQWQRDLGPMTWPRIDAGQSPAHTFEQAIGVLSMSLPDR